MNLQLHLEEDQYWIAGYMITHICIVIATVIFFCNVIWAGICRDFDAWIEKRCEIRIADRAAELSALHTQSEIEMLARKYTDKLFEKEPIFAVPGEEVKGNANPVFLKMPGEFIEKTMLVEATAYWTHDPIEASGDGIAYDGTPAIAYKTLAVDPEVIPLQAEVYVPTIGWCRANDTGNAINGRIIDIAMPNRAEAWEWGRRLVHVRVRVPYKARV